MSVRNALQIPMELAYQRRVLFALELLDAATLQRLSRGLKVVAEGLKREPIINASGIFVWLEEDFTRLKRITIDPGGLPYEWVEVDASKVQRPLTTLELPPLPAYPFATGVTGLRGTLIEKQVIARRRPTPVTDAKVHLEWKDEDGIWHRGSTDTSSNRNSGSFVSFLRFTASEKPLVENDLINVRLHVNRAGRNPRSSDTLQLHVGRITNPTLSVPLIIAWDDLRLLPLN